MTSRDPRFPAVDAPGAEPHPQDDASSAQGSAPAAAEDQDFGAILAAFEADGGARSADPKPGEKVRGEVVSISAGTVFVDLGAKSEGAVPVSELTGDDDELTVALGDTVEGVVTGRDDGGSLRLSVRPGHGSEGVEALVEARRHGLPVEGTVISVVKGGVEVQVGAVRAFCPISQLDTTYVENAEDFVGRSLEFRIEKLEEGGGGRRPNVVVSRRALLEELQRAQRDETLSRLEPGMIVEGTVTSVTSYGAFIDLGGVEGLLHVSEMSRGRVEDPASLAAAGQRLEVEVLTIEDTPTNIKSERRKDRGPRISLSRKTLERDPWQGAELRYPQGAILLATVRRTAPFGAFLEIEPGLDALLPRDALSSLAGGSAPAHPDEVLTPGQSLDVKVERVDEAARRMSLRLVAGDDGAAPGDPAYDEYLPQKKSSSSGFGSLGNQLGDLLQKLEPKDGDRKG